MAAAWESPDGIGLSGDRETVSAEKGGKHFTLRISVLPSSEHLYKESRITVASAHSQVQYKHQWANNQRKTNHS